MAAFDHDAVLLAHPLDFTLLQNGPISLFRRQDVLDDAVTALRALGYAVAALDAASWTGAGDLHDAFAAALDFPAHYGRNLDALADCLGDVAVGDHGWDPASTGLAIVVRHVDAFTSRDPTTARYVLDTAADCARTGLLFGHRLVWLLQVDDPHTEWGPVGGTVPAWNPAE